MVTHSTQAWSTLKNYASLLLAQVFLLLLFASSPALAALPSNGVQNVTDGMANGTSTLSSFLSGFNFTNDSGYNYLGDPAGGANGIYPNVATSSASTTFTVNADGTNLGSFDLTAINFTNFSTTFNFGFTITGYKLGGGTVSTSFTATGQAFSSGTYTSFTGITGFQVTFVSSNTGNPSNITFDSFTIANATATVTTPGAPTITGITPGNGQLSVAFTAGSAGSSAITNYEYSTNGGGLFTAVSPAATTSPIVITGLTNGSTYQVQIRAVNGSGSGTATASSPGTPATVPGAPTIGTATAGNAQASVTFTAPGSNGGAAITTYTATASPGGATGTCAGPAACTITVTGLTNGTAYTFTVTATNSAGTGSASSASNSATPTTVPGAPTIGTATAGNAQATVTFTAPGSDGGAAITTYTATSSPGGITGTCAGPAACAITVTGLTNGTAYTFAVTATNSTGTGSASAASNSVTPATVPGAPTIGTATAGNAQASVTFTAPASNGGAAITTYTATANPGGATGTCAGPAACTITVTGLTNGTAYTFTVTATNSVGTGSASSASNSATPTTVPGAPTIGTATSGNAQATVTFTAPGSDGGAAITTYTATSSPGGITGTCAGPAACAITVTGLTNGTAYTFAVTATNSAGTGSASAASNSVTPATVPGAPTIGTATAGDTQASVTFTAPGSNGGAAITTYTATANPGGATGTCAGPAACTITVTGLTNGTAYTFTVTATNSAGTGSASVASNSVTPKAAQTITFTNPGAQNFGTTPTLSASSTSGLSVTFTSSTTGVCTITSGGALTFVTAGTCTIDADQAGNATYNAAATVSRSFTVNAVVPNAPTIGTATAGDTQASITFSAPASTGGAAIISYTATANPGGATGTNATSPVIVTGLTNGTAYTFTVTATNSAGPGSASAASNSVTPKAAQTITFANPGTQNFGTTPTLTATADSSLTPTFTSSTTGVCTITSGGALTFVTTGTCTINADQAGNGSFLPASQVSRSFTVAAVAPGAPTIGTATAGDTQASVTFTAPAFNGGATITGYTVTSNPGGLTGTGAASPIPVTGLTNGVAYTFTVTATNAAGPGAASAASNSVTPAPGPAVTSVTVPANGSYGVGRALNFTVTWDQNTTVTGTPRIALVIGATTVQADYVSSPTPTTSLFRYTVLAGQADGNGITVGALTLNGGTIRNATNIDATLTLNSVGSTAAVLVETTPPTLPVANIVVNNQADPHKLVLTFSENLDAATLGSAAGWTVTANGGTPAYSVASVALAGGNQVTLTLSAVDLSNAATTITNVAANAHLKVTPPATLTDVAGNAYAAGLVTEAGATHVLDATAPTLSAVATSAPTTSGGALAATSSEKAMGYWIAVAGGSAAPTVAQTQAGVAYGAVTVVAHGSGALPNATAGSFSITGLSASTTYDIYVVAQDAAGNLSAGASTATLTTAAVVVPDPVSDPFTPLPTPAPLPGINGLPGVVNMGSGSGPAISNCLIDTLRQTLGGDAVYLGQTANGEVRVGWNGQLISFYPLAASTTDARSTGLHNQGTNPLDVVTSCGSLNVTPALFNPSGLGAILAGMGTTAQINQQGVITVLFNGTYYVVRPDFVVTTGTSGGPSLGFGLDGLLRFTDANGNTQILRPAVLDPGALQTQVGLMGGSMVVQLDGTVLMALGNGQQFVLTPDLTLGAIPPQFASLYSWQDGPAHYGYRIMTAPHTLYSQGVSVTIKP